MKLEFKVAFPKEENCPSFSKGGPFQRRLSETGPSYWNLKHVWYFREHWNLMHSLRRDGRLVDCPPLYCIIKSFWKKHCSSNYWLGISWVMFKVAAGTVRLLSPNHISVCMILTMILLNHVFLKIWNRFEDYFKENKIID